MAQLLRNRTKAQLKWSTTQIENFSMKSSGGGDYVVVPAVTLRERESGREFTNCRILYGTISLLVS